MKQIEKDIEFVKSILPTHYKVVESQRKGSVFCDSLTGIPLKKDAEDTEHWGYIYKAIESHFADKFQEVSHAINFLHKRFTIHLKTA